MGEEQIEAVDSSIEQQSEIEIIADIASSFTYASFQNAIPVIRAISLRNASGSSVENCRLELTSNPPFLRPKTWQVDRLLVGDTLSLSDKRVDLDPAYLAGLDEAERGEITLTLRKEETIVNETRIAVRLLARDEWGGITDMAQLLPAFVMPNDPAVMKVLVSAAEQLAKHGHASGMDGYQSKDPKRAFMLTASIYSAIAAMGLHYAEPPASFESRGQKVRRPSIIAADRLATCLDTTLLFAACLEAAGLNPIILLSKEHATIGVWLTQHSLPNAIETDATEIRKALALREMIMFETTGVTHRPAMTLEHSRQVSERHVEESQTSTFLAAIDVRRCRSGGITPLASHEIRQAHAESNIDIGPLPLPAEPDMSMLPAAQSEVIGPHRVVQVEC